ncbi:hypothetical protein SDJN02_09761, partial [Cucurbita argyrosperma subsp. argyrosperma]
MFWRLPVLPESFGRSVRPSFSTPLQEVVPLSQYMATEKEMIGRVQISKVWSITSHKGPQHFQLSFDAIYYIPILSVSDFYGQKIRSLLDHQFEESSDIDNGGLLLMA